MLANDNVTPRTRAAASARRKESAEQLYGAMVDRQLAE